MNNLNGLLKPEELLKKAEAYAKGEITLEDLTTLLPKIDIPERDKAPTARIPLQETYTVNCPRNGCLIEVASPHPQKTPIVIHPTDPITFKNSFIKNHKYDQYTEIKCPKCHLHMDLYWKF